MSRKTCDYIRCISEDNLDVSAGINTTSPESVGCGKVTGLDREAQEHSQINILSPKC